jgi:hypothetical protein
LNERIKILLIVFCGFFVSCTENRNGNTCEKNYCIIDTIDASGKLIDLNWFESEYCPILYLGDLTDTIIIDHLLYYAPIPPPNPELNSVDILGLGITKIENYDSIQYQNDLAEYKKDVEAYPLTKYLFLIDSIQNLGSIYTANIQINVDTNLTISKMGRFDFIKHKDDYFEAYPVIITNQGTDTLVIGYQRHLNLTVEAIDSSGNWSKIMDSHNIHGLPLKDSYMLLPGLSVITSTFKTYGEFKTKLRVKIGNNTSNEWQGSINQNQFNSKFDESGDYKFEYIEQQKNKTTTR